MYRTFLSGILVWTMLLLHQACSSEEPPVPPRLSVGEVTEVTRNGACLSASVSGAEASALKSCCFRYGLSEAMEEMAEPVREENGSYTARLQGLKAGSRYRYCFEISSGKSVLQSPVYEFVTLPNLVPGIGNAELVTKGPLSVAVKCRIDDAGGEAFTRIGFLYGTEGSDEGVFAAAATVGEQEFGVQIGGLNMGTDYWIRACAANSLGESVSEPLHFQTNSAIRVAEPGTLGEIIGTEWKYRLEELTVAGTLNGSDFRFLREMLGRAADGTPTEGCLRSVNLQDARIVTGGEPYYMSRYTADDEVGTEMFADCARLEQLILPQSVTVIQEDAFRGCSKLAGLQVPQAAVSVGFSSGCTALEAYTLSPLNTCFAVVDGVLYSADRTELLRYPMGKGGSTFVIPSGVTKIGESAFRESQLQLLTIPDGVTAVGRYACAASALTSAKVGSGVLSVPTGLFQQCKLLSTVTLGENVRRVADYAFIGCTVLTDIRIQAVSAPALNSEAFDADIYAKAVLTVPQGCKVTYRSSAWGSFERLTEGGD